MAKRGRKSTAAQDAEPAGGAAAPDGQVPATPASAPKPATASRKGRKRKTAVADGAEQPSPQAADPPPPGVAAVAEAATSELTTEAALGLGPKAVAAHVATQMVEDQAAGQQAESVQEQVAEEDLAQDAIQAEEQAAASSLAPGVSGRGRPRKGSRPQPALVAEPAVPELTDWQDGVALGQVVTAEQEKEDSRRFAYHRRLYSAAQAGDVLTAENILAEMSGAGLAPGPAALHALVFAHTKAGDVDGGLEVAAVAVEAGMKLLPESLQALIYAALEANPPEVELAQTLLDAVREAQQDPTPAWRTLVVRLAARGARHEAAAQARQGMAQGMAPDVEVAELLMQEMTADEANLDEAFALLNSLPRLGVSLEPRLYDPLVRALARRGELPAAEKLIGDMYLAQGGVSPNVDTYNAFLDGLVHTMSSDPADPLAYRLERFRDEMLKVGLRPNRHTFRIICEGSVKLRDADAALTAFESMRAAAGVAGSRLMSPDSLASLLRLLAGENKPYDLLKVLNSLAEDQVAVPPQALQPIDESGLTLLSSWVAGRMEQLARPDGDSSTSMVDEVARSIRYVNDVPIGPGNCVVDEQGVIVAPAKMTMQQIRAEAEARGIMGANDRKRPELMAEIKAARAALPFRILQEQKQLQELLREQRLAERIASGGADNRQAQQEDKEGDDGDDAPSQAPTGRNVTRRAASKRGVIVVEGNVKSWRDGELVESRQVYEERPMGKFFRVRSEEEALESRADFESNVKKATSELDLEATLTGGDLEEGVSTIVNLDYEDYEDAALGGLTGARGLDDGDDGEDEEDEDEEGGKRRGARATPMKSLLRQVEDVDGPSESLQALAHFDNRRANLSAGTAVAMDLLRIVETLGGSPTPADIELLAQGALAERNPAAATALAPRLHVLATAGGRPLEQVGVLLEQLASMCLESGAAEDADVVLEEAERRGFAVPSELLQQLQAALGGKLRRQQLEQRRTEALRGLVSDGQVQALALDDVSELQQQQRQQLDEGADADAAAAATAVASSPAVLDAEAVSARDEEEGAHQAGQQQITTGGLATAADGAAEGAGTDEGSNEEQVAVYEKDGEQYVEYVPEEGEVLVLDAQEMWEEERQGYRDLLAELGADEDLDEDEIDEIIEDPAVMANYQYLSAALEQYKEVTDAGRRLRAEFAQSVLERFGQQQLADEGALEIIQAWANGERPEGQEEVAFEEWQKSLEGALAEVPSEVDQLLAEQEGRELPQVEVMLEGQEEEEEQTGEGEEEEGEQQQGEQEELWDDEGAEDSLLELLEGQLTDDVLERFLESGTLELPGLEEALSQQQAAELRSSLEAAYGQLPPELLRGLGDNDTLADSATSSSSSSGLARLGSDSALALDEEQWEARALEMLEARLEESGLSLEEALFVGDGDEADAPEFGASRGTGGRSGAGVAGAVRGSRCGLGMSRAGTKLLWLGRHGWVPAPMRSMYC